MTHREPIELHDDDKPVGRVLTRREVMKILGGAGAVMLTGTGFLKLGMDQIQAVGTPTPSPSPTTIPACVVRPAKTEGPYFVDEMLNRSDIRVEPSDGSIVEGALLHLVFRVQNLARNTCSPLEGAQVDVWHCDARGYYSDEQDPGFDTTGQKWLRGYQITDAQGVAEFTTIYPGWYSGRTVHIHFKIRLDPASEEGYEFTSQLFFPEALSDIVQAEPPYATKGYRDTLNADDNIYQDNGNLLLLDVVETDEGYEAIFDIALDLTQPSTEENTFAPPAGGGPNGTGRPPNGQPPRGTPAPR